MIERKFKFISLLLLSAFLLVACEKDRGIDFESIAKERDKESGITILSAKVIERNPINQGNKHYIIEGEFQYHDDRYLYLGEFGSFEVFEKLNGQETIPFRAELYTARIGGAWQIIETTLPILKVHEINRRYGELTATMLFSEAKNHGYYYSYGDGRLFFIKNRDFQANINKLLTQYEMDLEKQKTLNHALDSEYKKLFSLEQKLAEEEKKKKIEVLAVLEEALEKELKILVEKHQHVDVVPVHLLNHIKTSYDDKKSRALNNLRLQSLNHPERLATQKEINKYQKALIAHNRKILYLDRLVICNERDFFGEENCNRISDIHHKFNINH